MASYKNIVLTTVRLIGLSLIMILDDQRKSDCTRQRAGVNLAPRAQMRAFATHIRAGYADFLGTQVDAAMECENQASVSNEIRATYGWRT